jgi:hypothetical protein
MQKATCVMHNRWGEQRTSSRRPASPAAKPGWEPLSAINRNPRPQSPESAVKSCTQKRRRYRAGKASGTALSQKAAAAVDVLQAACDRRMTEANAANDPKQPLFHYTNHTALFSILDSSQFWFTSIYHMDDPEELNFGLNSRAACSVKRLGDARASHAGSSTRLRRTATGRGLRS